MFIGLLYTFCSHFKIKSTKYIKFSCSVIKFKLILEKEYQQDVQPPIVDSSQGSKNVYIPKDLLVEKSLQRKLFLIKVTFSVIYILKNRAESFVFEFEFLKVVLLVL